ncbi:peptidoglycan recognition protein family protein [Nocardiopsis mwathae]|nr:peptidoglycan-binding domain-containing protein [Nocardiopsis mwathae]
MVYIRSRSSWGARSPRNRQGVSRARRVEFTVHYSQGPTTQTPRQIQNFHMDSNGWADIGYNFLVDRSGVVYEGRGWNVAGAHAAPRNVQGIGVCFIGRDGDATDAAKRSIRALYEEACRRVGRRLRMRGHRDINSTSCPGDDLYAWVKSGMPVDGAPTAPASEKRPSAEKAPPFPLPARWAFGRRTGPTWMVSGYYSHRSDLRRWQHRMRQRGWNIAADGLYGPQTERVTRRFQREKGLSTDGLIGKKTWEAAWAAPVT